MSTEVDEFLAHHGVMGMKWGKHKARGARPSRAERSQKRAQQKVDRVKAQIKATNERDSAIEKARSNLDKHGQKYTIARAQYKIDKAKVGKAKAKDILRKAESTYLSTVRDANLETSKERNDRIAQAVKDSFNRNLYGN